LIRHSQTAPPEAVREHDRLGATFFRAAGEQFERAASGTAQKRVRKNWVSGEPNSAPALEPRRLGEVMRDQKKPRPSGCLKGEASKVE
jgi:hypothetical protein